MESFMNENFLLKTETGKKLYHEFARDLPIIDYHCHVSPKEIYEDKRFKNITEVWLGGDHYKWRLMRSNGVDEYFITGDAPDREKFQKFSEVLAKAIGNPMYHWCHLELKKYFGYDGILNGDTAEDVWRLAEKKLSEDGMSVRGIIEKSNVAFIGTTDDPVDSLEWHKKIKDEGKLKAVVAPSFRPDKAFKLEDKGYSEYISALSEASGIEIDGIGSLKAALKNRMEHFNSCGCKASDHGLNYIYFEKADQDVLDNAVKKALSGQQCTVKEIEAVGTELLVFCAAEYKKMGWVMQLHFNCLRNPNTKMFNALGADTGFDVIGPHNGCEALVKLLDAMYSADSLPKTILYSLDSTDNAFIDTVLGAFQQKGFEGTLQHGSAWWFNDTHDGMTAQLKSLASLSVLGNFVGMLTDSRSFLSYTRHEYFRRILCNLIGSWVEDGEYPCDEKALKEITEGISYYNARKFFSLEEI